MRFSQTQCYVVPGHSLRIIPMIRFSTPIRCINSCCDKNYGPGLPAETSLDLEI